MRVLLILVVLFSGCVTKPLPITMVESATKAGCVMARWSRQVSKEYILCYRPTEEDPIPDDF